MRNIEDVIMMIMITTTVCLWYVTRLMSMFVHIISVVVDDVDDEVVDHPLAGLFILDLLKKPKGKKQNTPKAKPLNKGKKCNVS